MLRLGIEGSTAMGSVAVARDDTLLAEVTVGLSARHAELLLPAIDFALRAAGVERAALDEIVVGAGPGSFTGVRIAAATARGLAAALQVPLGAHSSLAVLAAASGVARRPVCALFDARKGEVYAACYRFSPLGMETLLAPCAAPVGDVVAQIQERDVVYTGSGAHAYREQLNGEMVPALLGAPRAGALLWLQQSAPGAAQVADAAHWEPMYLRGSGAQRGAGG